MDILIDIPDILVVSSNFQETPLVLVLVDMGNELSTKSDRIVLIQSLLMDILEASPGLVIASVNSDDQNFVKLHYTRKISDTPFHNCDTESIHLHTNALNYSRTTGKVNLETFSISQDFYTERAPIIGKQLYDNYDEHPKLETGKLNFLEKFTGSNQQYSNTTRVVL